MKTVIEIPFVFFLCTLLCSCPYSSPHSIDEQPGIYVEEVLIGNWATMVKRPGTNREEPVKMILTKRTDTEYNIAFTGSLEEFRRYNLITADSIIGTAFMSIVGENQFLNINVKSRIYIAELKLKNDKLSLLPLVEHFTGKMIKNSAALRNSIDFHYKSRVHAMLDQDFCLRDMVKVN